MGFVLPLDDRGRRPVSLIGKVCGSDVSGPNGTKHTARKSNATQRFRSRFRGLSAD